MNEFEKTIKAYLDQRASEDEEFAKKYANPEKSIEKCCGYIISEVQKSHRQGFADPEIYGMAVHYYDEADIKDIEKCRAKVVVNHTIELSELEKAEAKKAAIEKYQKEVIDNIKRKPTPKHKEEKKEDPQLNLF